MSVAVVTEFRSKTEQRVTAVIRALKAQPGRPLSYEELERRAHTPYDALLYILSTLIEVGCVEKISPESEAQGRPRALFRWKRAADGSAQDLGS